LRSAPVRVRGRDRRGTRQPPGRHGGKPARRSPRYVREGPLPGALLLHALCAHGPDPGAPTHGALRPPLMRRRLLWACVAAGSMAILAPLLPAYPLTLLTQTLIAAMLAMSLDLLLGYTGLPSLGHAAYFGVGAYAVAILATGH